MLQYWGNSYTFNNLWTPQNISDWVQLFIADAANVSVDGSLGVSQLNDLSGNNYHAVQATATNRPAWSATSFGGAPGITGGGTANQVLTHSAPQPGAAFSAFVIATNLTLSSTYRVLYSAVPPNSPLRLNWYTRFNSVSAQVPTYRGTITGSNPTLSTGTAYTLTTTTADASAGTASYTCRTNASAATLTFATTYQDAIDRRSLFNEFPGGTSTCPATVGACGYINRVLTAAEIERIEGWAAWKHGYTANLPAGHTYKNAAPRI
jgi:hypothetical protein